MLTSTDHNPSYFLPTQGSFLNFCDLVSAKGTITLTFLQTWMVIVIDSSYHLPCRSSFEKCLKPVPLSSFPSRLTGSHLRNCNSLWGPNILISLNNPLKSKHWVYKQFQFFYLKIYLIDYYVKYKVYKLFRLSFKTFSNLVLPIRKALVI